MDGPSISNGMMAAKVVDIRFTRIQTDQADRLIGQYGTWFSAAFLQRIDRYRQWRDRSAQCLGRLLLIAALKDRGVPVRAPLPIEYEPHGRPFLVSSPLDFNISHSRDLVVSALADSARIGIDLEYIQDLNLSDFKDILTPDEWRRINGSMDPVRTFYQEWTRKECVLKADGRGLTLPLSGAVLHNGRIILEDREWFIEEIQPAEGYACHLAVDTADFEVNLKEMTF